MQYEGVQTFRIPTVESLMNPVLMALRALGGSASTEQIYEKVLEIEHFNEVISSIPHDHKKEGNQTEVANRLSWARTYLKKYGLLENPSRNLWRLAPQASDISVIDPEEVMKQAKESNNKISEEYVKKQKATNATPLQEKPDEPMIGDSQDLHAPIKTNEKKSKAYSFMDAAEKVLEKFGNREPMHYRKITEKAREEGWLISGGKTPEASLYAQILTAIKRAKGRGEQARFVQHGKGFVSLSKWTGQGLTFQVEQYNKKVQKDLHARLLKMEWITFQELIAEQLLAVMGFEEIERTRGSKDGGIDVRGTLVVGDVIRTRMAIQVKRWKHKIQTPTVQQVRGSLGTHEQGLIITTSDFTSGAKKEAARLDATPVGLMNGEQLVKLLIENDIGVLREPFTLLSLEEAPEESSPSEDLIN